MATPNVVLPEKGKKSILVTSALPYVNNVPHLGNIIGSTLSADVYARYSRLRDRPTLYICGTDEYGTATETRALEAGVTPQALCDEFYDKHKAIYDWFELSFDYFGRTTTKHQTRIVQEAFLKLKENGYLEERTTTQPYCEKHESFLADRFVEGTCPKAGCGYEDARGDQCDKCGNLLDPFELINPKCKLDGATPVPRETAHFYIKLNELQPKVAEWFNDISEKGNWSANAKAITKAWLDRGLEGRSITRDVKWGVPVPLEGYEKKVIYVWFDAPYGYPSITASYFEQNGGGEDDWKAWWQNPEDVDLYQFMGKDNVPFHTVIWPASLIGAEGDKWTKLHTLSTTEYLNYENTKFSKSRGVGVFGDGAKETGVGPSVWRYYLLSNRPETGDTQFEWAGFAAANNNELLANLGNFVNRVVKFVIAKLAGEVPEFSASYTDESFDFKGWIETVQGLLAEYNAEMELVHLRAGLKKAMEISSQGNLLLQYRLDNASLAASPERTKTVIGLALNLASLLASIFSPYIPSTSESIVRQLNTDLKSIPNKWDPEVLKPGHKLGKAEYLFTRLDDKKIAEWKDRFGGTQASRAAEEAAKEALKKKKQEEKDKKKAKKAAKKAAEAEETAESSTLAAQVGADVKTAATEDVRQLPIREKPVEK